jgi:hypothetical protein
MISLTGQWEPKSVKMRKLEIKTIYTSRTGVWPEEIQVAGVFSAFQPEFRNIIFKNNSSG